MLKQKKETSAAELKAYYEKDLEQFLQQQKETNILLIKHLEAGNGRYGLGPVDDDDQGCIEKGEERVRTPLITFEKRDVVDANHESCLGNGQDMRSSTLEAMISPI